MTSPTPAWPDHFAPRDAATAFVERHASSPTRLTRILRDKLWGCTAVFETRTDPVVLKIAAPSLFPHAHLVQRAAYEAAPGATPELLAWEDAGDQRWSLFAYIEGCGIRREGGDGLIEAAEAMAGIQRAAAGKLPPVPAVRAATVVDLLDDLEDVPEELSRRLEARRDDFRRWGAELDDAVPFSLDHVDFHTENVLRAADGRVVIVDWEEAVVSCPLFSFDRFRIDADDHGVGALAERTYLQRLLPDVDADERSHLMALASRLAPLKAAAEARAFARVLGWSNPHTSLTTRLIGRSLAAAGQSAEQPTERRDVRVEKVDSGAGEICREILDTLPTWFGMADANTEYVASAERGPSYLAHIAKEPVGILLPTRHTDDAAEIGLLAVKADHRRSGIGRALVSAAEGDLATDGVRFFQVKTLSARRLDDGYEETRAFYRAIGFVPLEEHPLLWDESNPALQMIKAVAH